MKKLLVHFLLLIKIICCLQSVHDQERAEEYVGCFSETIDERAFYNSPGDYRANEVTPVQCLIVCGSAYKYAAIQAGSFCMCSNTVPNKTVQDSECRSICSGAVTYPNGVPVEKCGGYDTVSVYTAESRILGLAIKGPKTAIAFAKTMFEAMIVNGNNATFSFDFGDGETSKSLATYDRAVSHIYNQPGSYEISLKAENFLSGLQFASKQLTVNDELNGVEITCPKGTMLGKPIECHGFMSRGSVIDVSVDYGDGIVESVNISASYAHVGRVTPTLKPIKNNSFSSSATHIMTTSIFKTEEVITGWEIDASSAGSIWVQIFRPSCTSSEKLCHKNQSCVTLGSECEGNAEHSCGFGERYCFHSGRCMAVKNSSRTLCQQQSLPHQKPLSDYVLMYQYSLKIPTTGRQFFNLVKGQQFTVSPGDVIGWSRDGTTASGQIAYTDSEMNYEEFQFPLLSEIGGRMGRGIALASSKSHLISAHFHARADFTLYHTYKKTGAYVLRTNIFKPINIYVDVPIAGVELTCPSRVETGKNFSIAIADHAGSNPRYVWSPTDSNGTITTTIGELQYLYKTAAIHRLSVSVSNSLGGIAKSCLIESFDSIRSLRFLRSVAAVPFGNATTIAWTIASGTNVTFTVTFGDGNESVMLDSWDIPEEYVMKHVYEKTGHYLITITANNALGPKLNISTVAIVEIPIRGIHFYTNLAHITNNAYVVVGESVTMTTVLHQGSEPICTYQFSDMSGNLVTSSLLVKHTYSNTGRFIANVSCRNAISNANAQLNATIHVQELQEIRGLRLLAKPTVYGDITNISLKMQTGTVLICDWNLGDGSIHKSDFHMNALPLRHQFKSVGDFFVSVECRNRLGSAHANITIQIEDEIDGFHLSCPVKFVRIGQSFNVQASIRNGSRIKLEFFLGTRREIKTIPLALNQTWSVTNKFTNIGHYSIYAIASNSIRSLTKSCPHKIKAEYPLPIIHIVSNSPIKAPPGIVSYSWNPSPGFTPSTNVLSYWNYGDGSNDEEYWLEFGPVPVTLNTHKYNSSGLYLTKITLKNNVSSKLVSLEIEVLNVVPIKFTIERNEPSLNKTLPGYGAVSNIFSLEQMLCFSVTKQMKDKWYLFDFGGGKRMNTTVPIANHQYSIPGLFNVSVLVYNSMQTYLKWKSIVIQESINNASIRAISQIKTKKNMTFLIIAAKYGTSSCYIINFGDGHVALFNNSKCDNLVIDKLCTYEFRNFAGKEFLVNHTYSRRGTYNVTLEASNAVSYEKTSIGVEIIHRRCASPQISISGGGTEKQPMRKLKSDKLFLKANVTISCKEAKFAVFTWQIFHISLKTIKSEWKLVRTISKKASMPYNKYEGTTEPASLEIESGELSIGINVVKLKISFEAENQDISDIFGLDEVWFNTQATPLRPIIKGGIMRAIGYEMNLILDGSKSFDPDASSTDPLGLQFSWYCRRIDETFGNAYQSLNNTGAGCFKNGQYNISEHAVSKKVIQIYTGNLFQQQSYLIRLVVKKEQRENYVDQEIKVLPGNPPTMDIRCKMNCMERRNPANRLILESMCTDCLPGAILNFEWSLYEITSSGTKVKDLDLGMKTTTGIKKANLVVKENALNAGKEYSLKISAWKPGGNQDSIGFSEYRFKVNRPPHSGKCMIFPSQGFAVVTKFNISCDNWIDEDMPLKYKIDVVRDGNLANIYNGYENDVQTVLPVGRATSSYEISITALVSDRFGYGTKTILKVLVKQPVSIDLNSLSNDLIKLSSSGNVQALTQQAVAAGSVMNIKASNNQSNTNATNDAIEARTKIILAVSKITVCSLNQIRQIGDVYNEMTEKPEEVSQDAQVASTSAMSDLSDCMLNSSAQDPSLKATAFTMLQGTSKLLQAQMLRSEGKIDEMNRTEEADNSSTKILDTVTKVGGSLLRQLVAGDKPMQMKLPNMDIEMSQVPESADEDSTGFKIPDLQSLLGNTTLDGTKQSVGAMVSSMKKNPYGSGATASDIKSNIVGLALTDAGGDAINVAGKELTMFVKRDAGKDMPAAMNQFNDSGAMRFHRFNYTSLENAVAFEVKPVDTKLKLRLFIAYNKRPSMKSFLKNHTFTSKEEALRRAIRLPDPFVYVIPNGDLNRTGRYFIGVMMLNKKDLYAGFGYNPSLNYTLRVFETKCKVWDDTESQWTTKGCKVGPKTTFNSTQCTCRIEAFANDDLKVKQAAKAFAQTSDVQTQTAVRPAPRIRKVVKRVSFAGGFFVAPNPIDFDKAFDGFSNLASNPVAFSTVLSILGLYLILLFWARREDRKDLLKAGVTPLQDNDCSDRQFYEITVFTGFSNSSGTTSRVFIQLNGEDGSSEPRELSDPNRIIFQKRAQDTFLASYDDFYGDLNYIRIWHDNSGKKPSWYLSKVAIHDVNTGKRYLFINESWLAVEEGDGSIEKVLPVAGPQEIASFNHLFYSTTQKNLTDNHLWFSVFIRPARSRFTRVQRLSCCLTLIYCVMLTNAMFYQVGGQSDPSSTLKLGPFEFSASQIGIGVMSSLIIFPVNLLIVGVFRSVGAKPTKEELSKKKTKKFWWLYEVFFCCQKKTEHTEFMDIITSVPDSETDLKKKALSKCSFDEMPKQQIESGDIGLKLKQEDGKQAEGKKKKKKKLPWWMKYFAWTLLVLTSFTAAFFVVLYGFTFGRDKSAQWISSMLISFVQDVFISQPIKILFLGLFVALIVKKPAEEEEEDNKKQQDETYLDNTHLEGNESKRRRPKGIIKFKPPPKEKIQAARDIRLKEIKMYGLVKDIFLYFVFVMALCTVSYTHLDPKSYQFKKGLEDIFISASYGGDMEFAQISTREDYWTWLNTTVVQGLFSTRWYNGQPSTSGFTSDMNNNLFGGARLRQLRVKKDSCAVPKQVGQLLSECNDWYSWSDEDTRHYNPKWSIQSNNSLYKQPNNNNPWQYFTSNQLNTYPFAGSMALYSGGGYVGDLGKYPAKAYKLINELSRDNWFDKRTRAIFLEACVYNAQVNLFAIMNFVVEFLPTNGIVHYHSIKITRLYTYGGSTESFTIACQFFVIFFLLLFIYREGKKIYQHKKRYFKGFWNIVESTMIVLVIATISVYFSRLILVNSAIKQIHLSPGQYVSFNKVAKWDELFQYMMSFLVLVACIKSIRLLSFNKTISLLASTLKGSSKPLATFSVVFLIFFFAYVIFSFIIFVEHLEDFKSFVTCIESTMALLLGSFEFADIQNAQPILGPIYFVTLMLFGVMYILNVFMSIIMDTYAEVKGQLSKQSREYEIVDFMIGRFKRFIGIQPGGVSKTELKNDAESTKMIDSTNTKKHQSHQPMKQKNNGWQQKINSEDEIRRKFRKLDQSLNGFCIDDYADDDLVDDIIKQQYNRGSASGMRKEMYSCEMSAEAEYRQDLYDELNNWK